MEVTVVATAAPKIVESLGGLSLYSWLFTTYLLTTSVFMPAWGRVADHFGHKPIIIAALAVFLFGSLLCGLSQSMFQLLGARLVQGIGASALIPMSFTMLTELYTYRERARIQGLASSVWGISSIIGPFVGGLLTTYVHWRFIFLVNFIPGLPTLWLFAKYLPHQQNLEKLKLSPKSLVSSAFAICTVILSLSFLQNGEYSPASWLLVIAVLAIILFWHYERSEKYPLIKKEIFTERLVIAGCVTGFLYSGMLTGLANFSPLLFQIIFQYSITASGLLICSLSLAWVMGSFFSIEMSLRYNYKKMILGGMMGSLIGLILFMRHFNHLGTPSIIATFVLIGAGMAFNYPIVLVTTQHSVPKNLVSFATSTLVWTRSLGATVITTIMGITMSLAFENRLKNASLKNLDHNFIQMALDNPKLLMKPDALLHVQTDPILNQSFQEALFVAFFVILITSASALMFTWLFPDKVQIRE